MESAQTPVQAEADKKARLSLSIAYLVIIGGFLHFGYSFGSRYQLQGSIFGGIVGCLIVFQLATQAEKSGTQFPKMADKAKVITIFASLFFIFLALLMRFLLPSLFAI